jgi:HlyD family secretion protein
LLRDALFGNVQTPNCVAHRLSDHASSASSKRAFGESVEHAERQGAAVPGEDDKNLTKPGSPSVSPTASAPPAASTPVDPSTSAGAATPAAPARSFFDRYKPFLIVGLLILIAIAAGFALGRLGRNSDKNENRLVLYGNVDLRQVDLAFNNSERIAEVLVQEGAKITRGQILARLDTSRLKPQVATAQAMVDAQQAVVERLHHGSRPQEIAQAQANVASAQADQVNARQQWTRLSALTTLTTGRAISEQDLESAKAAMDSAQAHLTMAEKNFDLSEIGPRKEDIAQGEAQLRMNLAQLELLNRQLTDSELASPCDAVVRSRLMEPGEMANPQRAVLSLALTDPKWVRAYVSESDLGKIHTGMSASISTDSFPGRALSGWVGFIASVAEFTPKAVQTVELRSSLVYEIRVFVKDPQDEMRLGMPATVLLELEPHARGKP